MRPVVRTIAVIGHRYAEDHPLADSIKTWLRRQIEGAYTHNQTRTIISGMALGVDMWGAEITLTLKRSGVCPGLRLMAVVPFHLQFALWPVSERERWMDILRQADEIWIQKPQRPGQFWPITAPQLLADIEQIREEWQRKQENVPPERRTEFPRTLNASRLLNLRNRFVVDRSDAVLAVWEERKSGTGNTIRYATGKRPVRIYNPLTHRSWRQ